VRDTLMICPNSPYHLAIRKKNWVYIPRQGEGGFQSNRSHHLGGLASVAFMGKKHSDMLNGKLRENAPKAQLYHLGDDLEQTQNVHDQHPEVVKELSALLKKERSTIPKTKPIGWINIRLKKTK